MAKSLYVILLSMMMVIFLIGCGGDKSPTDIPTKTTGESSPTDTPETTGNQSPTETSETTQENQTTDTSTETTEDNQTTNPPIQKERYASWAVAKNNLVRDVSTSIGENRVKVLVEPDKQIGEDDTSISVDSVYGKINGNNTILRINQNYKAGTKMIVRIYDPSGNVLATSEELTYTGTDNNVKFNDINL